MNRNYGIDLLKAAAMLMVVTHHIMMASCAENAYAGMSDFTLQVFHSFCYCAVDCFVMATGYIMCQKDWKWQRIFKLWRQIVGYSIVLVIIGLIVMPKGEIGCRDWVNAVMPITMNRYWFITQYFAMFFLIPYLNILIRSMSVKESRNLVLGGFVLLTIFPFLSGIDLFVLKWGYCFVWFSYMYLVGAHIRNYGAKIVTCAGSGWLYLFLLVLSSVLSGFGVVIGRYLSARFGFGIRFSELSYSYASPTILIEAVCMIILFSKIEVRNARCASLIAACAPSIFIVYAVHSNMVFRRLVGWSNIFLALSSHNVVANIMLTVAIAVLIFCSIVLVDWLRRFFFVNLFSSHKVVSGCDYKSKAGTK